MTSLVAIDRLFEAHLIVADLDASITWRAWQLAGDPLKAPVVSEAHAQRGHRS
jgi:hypothetical protein